MRIYIQAPFSYEQSLERFYYHGFKRIGHTPSRNPRNADIAVCFKQLIEPNFLTGNMDILIYPDNPARQPDHFDAVSKYFDHIFLCHDKPIVNKDNVHYLPFGHDPGVHKTVETDGDPIDCLFIGTKHPSRAFMKDIPIIERYGTGWDDSNQVTMDEYRDLYTRAKIAINHRFPGDTSNMRQYEVLAMETMLLTDHEGEFRDGRDLVVYHGIEDMKEKIHYYLNHPKERRKIATVGHRHLINGNFRYRDRARYIMDTLGY